MKRTVRVFLCFFLFLSPTVVLAGIPPRPYKTVICFLENHGYSQIAGSPDAPYLNQLMNQGASLAEYYATTHPSQPNCLTLFSGSTQGVTDDLLPSGAPFTTPNLGASLITAGFSFAGFSEDLPDTGSTVEVSGLYARKHAPWVHWQGTGINQLPVVCNLPFTSFPADFDSLPDLSIVNPNLVRDMHNGLNPQAIINGDQWVQAHLDAYVQWAMTHNSLFIVCFDEDDNLSLNHVVTFFCGPMVQPGSYSSIVYNHFNLLRTVEDLYGLPYAGATDTATFIDEIWNTNGIASESTVQHAFSFPNPGYDRITIELASSAKKSEHVHLRVTDNQGRTRSEEMCPESNGKTLYIRKDIRSLANGIYTYSVHSDSELLGKGRFIKE